MGAWSHQQLMTFHRLWKLMGVQEHVLLTADLVVEKHILDIRSKQACYLLPVILPSW